MFGLFGRKARTTITAINIRLQGQVHQICGLSSSEKVIEIRIPFKNKVHSDMLTEAGVFTAPKGKPMTISSIKVSEPFTLVFVEPQAPLEIASGKAAEFKIRLSAPPHSYSGPLTVTFDSVSEEPIHIELARTILIYRGKRTEIGSSARMFNLQRNGIFLEKVQVMKATGLGDAISKAEVSPPFGLVSTDPRLPVKIDTPNGYLISFYIRAPAHNYSGDLEIVLS